MMVPPRPRRVEILGVLVDDVTEQEALDILACYIRSGEPRKVVTPNPEIVMGAVGDASYRVTLNAADLALPDGIGLLFAARVAGTPLRAHVRGTDVVMRLAERSVGEKWRWFLLGAQPGVAAEAAEQLGARFPGLQIVGTLSGTPDPSGDHEAREAIAAVWPVDVLLVAYGAPLQERWIERNARLVGVPVQVGVGGVLDFAAGRSPRAPVWIRRIELEWAYRLLTEPWRWRRQLALPRFALLAIWRRLTRQGRPGVH